ncbi:MAG: hypothetical protein HZB38_15025 [Planctomycetes bacterium]|nr:hypothetical protein [Planctomycetota bacterium]
MPRRFVRTRSASILDILLAVASAALVLGLAACPAANAQSAPSSPFPPLTVVRWQADPPTIEIEPPQDGFDPLLDRVIVGDDSGPLGRTTQNGEEAESGRFRLPMELAAGVKLPSAGVRAWLVPRDLVRRLRPEWPTGAPLLTTIENVGPGGESAWIRAGELQGVNKGQSWWRRVNGQPMYRLDVRYSGPDVSFCRVLRLAAEVRPAVEDAVALWPGPGEIREGRLSSAVSQIDTKQADPIVWVAKPPQPPCPSDARFDFYRNGRYVGYGVTERSDARFWYARLLAQACAGPLQVGDDAVVRTFADAASARSRGHVFASTQEGWLVTAGETDGVAAGMPAVVLRNGSPIGTVEIRRVQNAYCIVGDLIRPEGAAADSLQRLDESAGPVPFRCASASSNGSCPADCSSRNARPRMLQSESRWQLSRRVSKPASQSFFTPRIAWHMECASRIRCCGRFRPGRN